MKIRLKTSGGKYLSSHRASESVPLNAAAEVAGDSEEFWLHAEDFRFRQNIKARLQTNAVVVRGHFQESRRDRYVSLINDRGRASNRLYARYRGPGEHNGDVAGDHFELTRLNNQGKLLAEGDRIALRFVEDTVRPGYLSYSGGSLRLVEVERPGEHETFIVETMSELKLFWNGRRQDNFSTATPRGQVDAERAGYGFVRVQGRVYMNGGSGRRALHLFWHAGNGDNLLSATEEGEREALAAGYVKVRREGYVLEKPRAGTVPLRVYWQSGRKDSFAATGIKEEQSAADARYAFVREEGFAVEAFSVATSLRPAAPALPGGGQVPHLSPAALRGLNLGVNFRPELRPEIRPEIIRPRRRRSAGKKALVLSGGGAKGCFEVGAVQRLWEHGYRPDIICGVSVGALNAAKLAEAKDSSARELRDIWEELDPERGQGGRAVYAKDYFPELVLNWVKNMGMDFVDDALDPNVGLDQLWRWAGYAAAHLHALHSMQPLRDLIKQHLNISAIREGGTQLRLGITDLKTGQYFSVTEPFERAAFGLNLCGRIEVEPDHHVGDTWLSRPIFGADAYAMSIEDAIYASAAMPVFMDPTLLNLRLAQPVPYRGERITLLKAARNSFDATYSPPGLEELMRATGNGTRKADDGAVFDELKNGYSPAYDLDRLLNDSMNWIKGDSLQAQHHLFDGGLRDTMAIRTAMRLGAREIIVITGDRLQAAPWAFKNPGTIGEDFTALPAVQYLFGLLGVWFNEAARTDMLLGVAQNEYLGWLYRCYSLLDEDKRRQISREYTEYWRTHGNVLNNVLGASSWIGGEDTGSYGVPFLDEGCSINYIAPNADLLDALAFDDWEGIQEGMDMGYEAALDPIELSYPVTARELD